jgi:hypothetical protein
MIMEAFKHGLAKNNLRNANMKLFEINIVKLQVPEIIKRNTLKLFGIDL